VGTPWLSLPPVPGIMNLKSGAKAASMSDSLPLLTAVMTLDRTSSLSALVDIVEGTVVYLQRDMHVLYRVWEPVGAFRVHAL
jgi:hypothetical protein